MPNLHIVMPFSSERELSAALAALTALDVAQMTWTRFPPLYQSGIRYRRERPGQECWLTAAALLRARFGDCEDIACYLSAELQLQGERATAIPVRSGAGAGWHIVVRRGDGSIEDPSRRLGMRGPIVRSAQEVAR